MTRCRRAPRARYRQSRLLISRALFGLLLAFLASRVVVGRRQTLLSYTRPPIIAFAQKPMLHRRLFFSRMTNTHAQCSLRCDDFRIDGRMIFRLQLRPRRIHGQLAMSRRRQRESAPRWPVTILTLFDDHMASSLHMLGLPLNYRSHITALFADIAPAPSPALPMPRRCIMKFCRADFMPSR